METKKIKTVLLVDDDRINNFINEKLIRKLNFCDEVLVSLNGMEALELLQERKVTDKHIPELILLDINMPVMDGFEFIENLRAKDPDTFSKTVIVMLTTSTNQKDIDKFKMAGIKDYINKPLTGQNVSEIVNSSF